MSQILKNYFSSLHSVYISGQATEHSYRKSLENMFHEITGHKIINEPKRSEHGAPDFIFQDGMFPVCYAEAKDITVNLEKIENSEQLSRYFGYAKLILTNGLEFRFYNNGTRYGEPIVLAKISGSQLTTHEDQFEYFLKTFGDFLGDYVDTIRNAGDLAKIMGGKARRIRDNVASMLAFEDDNKFQEIKQMKRVFRELLIHDLDEKTFADLYSQTLVYGLFVARYNDTTPEDFSRSEARELVPKSNPLLRKFFDHIAGEAFEKRLAYIVDELCNVFTHADVHALMHGLYQKRDIETHDPVIHFYEDFLKEYDKQLRMDRGVFYTPMPVVQFMVRSVDEILKKHFALGRGLLDTSKIDVSYDSQVETKSGKIKKSTKKVHRVQLLDPAVGTGTFLNEVIKFAHSKMSGQQGNWEEYVNTDLLPRLHGFELMMASYTIAHLKLGLTLSETGVSELKDRLKVYLTNSLEEGIKVQNDLLSFGLMGSLTEEAQQAGHIKSDEPIMIVLGNPPYNGESKNKGEWIMNLMNDYKKEPNTNGSLNERNSKWINNDYVKFIRLSHHLISKNKEGILSFITSNSYLDSITFRGMRYELLKEFDEIYIVDLNGYSERPKYSDEFGIDKNVFDIKEGVSIIFAIKKVGTKKGLGNLNFFELIGTRDYKYNFLNSNSIESIDWQKIEYSKPNYFFTPQKENSKIYNSFFSLKELFINNSVGVLSHRDKYSIDMENSVLEKRIDEIFNQKDENLFEKYALKKGGRFSFDKIVKGDRDDYIDSIKKYNFRVFDERYIIYNDEFIDRSRKKVLKHMAEENISLIIQRQTFGLEFHHVFVSDKISDLNFISNLGGGTVCPLYLYSEPGTFETGVGEVQVVKTPNLDEKIWKKINKIAGETTPENILDYIYAVLHSSSYRENYKEFLKIDFPKIPFPESTSSFFKLAKLGEELREYHLLKHQNVWEFTTTFPESGDNIVDKIIFQDDKVYMNENQYFGGVPENVFQFQIGGYQPAQKYLKDRKGKKLTSDEFDNYQKMIVALSETIRIMGEIEKVFKV